MSKQNNQQPHAFIKVLKELLEEKGKVRQRVIEARRDGKSSTSRAGISINELVEKHGVSADAISKLPEGKRDIPLRINRGIRDTCPKSTLRSFILSKLTPINIDELAKISFDFDLQGDERKEFVRLGQEYIEFKKEQLKAAPEEIKAQKKYTSTYKPPATGQYLSGFLKELLEGYYDRAGIPHKLAEGEDRPQRTKKVTASILCITPGNTDNIRNLINGKLPPNKEKAKSALSDILESLGIEKNSELGETALAKLNEDYEAIQAEPERKSAISPKKVKETGTGAWERLL